MNGKKPLPFSCTKRELVRMYLNQVSEYVIITEINEIILENRKDMKAFKNKTRGQIIMTRKVFGNELKLFVENYGLPKDYYAPEQ